MSDIPLREVSLWQADLAWETRDDGSMLIWQTGKLPDYPDRLSDRIVHWARATPDTTWMAERADDGGWTRVSYGELLGHIKAIGQGLLTLGLGVERPLVILSGNSVAHALMALGAQYAGIPSSAVAPAYALVPQGFEKLHAVRAQITPGAVFAEDTGAFAPALHAVFADLPVIGCKGPGITHDWQTLLATPDTQAAERANAATGPDTVAKFLFTSGTTGAPKAVIQTQRMLCSNMAMAADCFAYFADEPPVFLDWPPWNHVASGNKVFNMTLYNGGTFYIDAGKPTPGLIGETIRNLREISPTWYFNVPAGFEMLIEAMKADAALAENFFRDLKLMMYAGAVMAAHTWQDLQKLAQDTTGSQVFLTNGFGSTETAPFALFNTDPAAAPGNIGVPAKGIVLKLVPNGGKWEARLKGPSITPGYWRDPDLSAQAFDDEGYYKLGDAFRFAEDGNPAKGFFFDGRLAENFKMSTGTWVGVGALRAAVTNALQGTARDVVVVGEGRAELGGLLVPFRPALTRLVPDGDALSDADLCAHPAVRDHVAGLLAAYNATAGGASLRLPRVMFLTDPLDLDRGEVTDKGSVNQRAVLANRADLAEALYGDDLRVIHG
ncbi:MAG: feruloyl-CoA synthase [Rhodobacter sp.]|nr:feruloyl-CoA synthase [Rhodobacter sp.]